MHLACVDVDQITDAILVRTITREVNVDELCISARKMSPGGAEL
jgi:hypothetical protein